MSEDSSGALKVGIVGAGNMGTTHATCWSRLPGAQVVAIADGQTHKARALAQIVAEQTGAAGGPAPTVLASADEMLAHADVDVISVCVPTNHHRPVAEAALRAKKHVLCEKPMALSIGDCDAMMAAAEAAGTVFTVAQVVRCFPEYARAKSLVDVGAVGQPAAVRARRGGDFPRTDTDWYADPARSGGIIFDLMVHDIDWLGWCFGPVTRVYAQGLTERLAAGELDHLDYALLTLRHASGVISHLEGTWADPGGFATAFEIAGDAGLLTHDSRRAAPLSRSLRAENGAAAGVAVPSSPLAPGDDPYFREIESFAQSVRTGAPLFVTPAEAHAAVAVAVAARESLRTGQAVAVNKH